MDMSGQLHAPAALPQGNNPGIQITGGFVRRRAGLHILPLQDFIPCIFQPAAW